MGPYAKKLMERFNVPTAAYREIDDYEEALNYEKKQGLPIVIKADGLTAGNGVTVAETLDEAETPLKSIMVQNVFGQTGTNVVIEECYVEEK
jgi:phosphoribosylamine--glycine ligase